MTPPPCSAEEGFSDQVNRPIAFILEKKWRDIKPADALFGTVPRGGPGFPNLSERNALNANGRGPLQSRARQTGRVVAP